MARQLQGRTVDRRRLLTGSAAAVGGAALAGRGLTGTVLGAGRAQDKTKVTFWFFSEWVAQAVTAFNEKNPNIEVEFQ
jgi:ABC-type glycerol-3-phosphate transport system substrate-binding protein